MTLVRDQTGRPLPCVYGDCQRTGHDQVHVDVDSDGQPVRHIFCSDQHRNSWKREEEDAEPTRNAGSGTRLWLPGDGR